MESFHETGFKSSRNTKKAMESVWMIVLLLSMMVIAAVIVSLIKGPLWENLGKGREILRDTTNAMEGLGCGEESEIEVSQICIAFDEISATDNRCEIKGYVNNCGDQRIQASIFKDTDQGGEEIASTDCDGNFQISVEDGTKLYAKKGDVESTEYTIRNCGTEAPQGPPAPP